MTTITKEQLISHARESVSYLEDLKGRASKEGEDCKVVLEMVERELELVRIALASLEAEPVAVNDDMAYAFHHALSDSSLGADEVEEIKAGLRAAFANVTIQPEPVVPDEIEPDDSNTFDYVDGWNACRAAMLHSAEPVSQAYKLNALDGNSPATPDSWISCSERMPVIGELNWRTSFPLLVTCEIGVIPAYYGFVSVNGDRHYGFMESLKYGDDNGNHPQTNEYGLISNVTHWMPLPEPPQEVK
ncbi:DUF551 domain-containing protein [Escherichia coli]|uniref:DUF551 domain-containing protein n=1 Tax=Escherichia coli TaxID=562 RepID=UPI000DA58E9E|nr:DUF551 domain-containing protein [Escherichia coli]SQP09935.1 putative prophage protein [Escherichia coli]HCO5366815.1 DUF551 domain-containing protein [Escherichia coli]